MGPDEDHDGVSNNAYTNVAVGLALFFAEYIYIAFINYIYTPYTPQRDTIIVYTFHKCIPQLRHLCLHKTHRR